MFARMSVAAAVLAAAAVASAAPEAAAPAATDFRVGAYRLTALVDARNVVPNDGKVFGTDQSPQAVAEVLQKSGLPTDRITLSVDALLVRLPGHVVLIDTGLGPKAAGVLPKSLALAGVTPDQVTDVLITHSHGDHVGGLLDAAGRPAFPKAVVRMSEAEWATMRAKPQAAGIALQVRAFAPGRAILPGITPVAITGHTPGHVGYRIESQGQRLFDMGDTAHSSVVSLAHPEWSIEYDGDDAAGKAARRATLARLATSGERVWAPHFPYPGVGRIVPRGTGYVFRADALPAPRP